MITNELRQIFLSAVTREFERARQLLRSDLMGPDLPCKVIEQSDFTGSAGTLLEKLHLYVSESIAMVHLIGEATGSTGKPLEVEAYLKAHPQFLVKYPLLRAALGDCNGISYTQWEAYMALHLGVPLYIYLPDAKFDERPPGFQSSPEEVASQSQHLERLQNMGLDRSPFLTAERLSSQVLRSLSRMLNKSGTQADKDSAVDLEVFAQLRGEEETEADEARSVLVPVHLELALPAHLLVGQSVAAEFCLKEPGRTALEHVQIEFEIGESRVKAQREIIGRGQSARLVADAQIVLPHEGTPPMRLALSCERSCIRERFEWKAVANVITAETLLNRTGTMSRSKPRPRKIRLELVSEELRPRRGALDMDLQPIPAAGCRFDMGSPSAERGRQPDEVLHPVRFQHSWWMARHPVSQAQFLEVMKRNPASFNDQSDRFPVENVTWFEAVEFCERLTQIELSEDKLPLGFHYRLPTEAEWEYSCKAGHDTMPQTSSSNSRSGTEAGFISHPISTFPLDGNRGANRYGLCDMSGNVFQWCLDFYGPYPSDLAVDPCLEGPDSQRVIRGGSWYDPLPLRRPAARMQCKTQARSSRIGFRVVLARV